MKKNPVGRPTDYKPEYCQGVIEYGKKGLFHFEFANSIDQHVSTIYRWGEKFPEFSESLNKAKQACEGYWLNIGRSLIATSPKEHDSKPWWYIMNNLHGWGEKQKVEISGVNGGPVKTEAILDPETSKELKRFLRIAGKTKANRK